MNLDWAHLKTTVERCLNSAEKGERGGLRVHCVALERMLKGTKDGAAQAVMDNVHHAKTAIDIDKGVEYLQKALDIAAKEAGAG